MDHAGAAGGAAGRLNGAARAEIPMTFMAKPKIAHPEMPKNVLGLTRRDYEGVNSTLCAGCGHDSITDFGTSRAAFSHFLRSRSTTTWYSFESSV